MQNDMNPSVSVIMGVYKEPLEWIRQAVDSILSQTFSDFEFIILLDNPNYVEGLNLLKEYESKDNRIVIVCNDENIGLTKSLNKGLALARGKYIARMDADDISLPNRFEYQFSFMEEHPNVIVLGTNIKYIGRKSLVKGNDSIKFDNSSIRAQMIMVNCIAHSSVFIRSCVLKDNHIKYDESYRQSQDYRLWELLSPYGDFAVLPDKLLKYRVSDQQITKSQTKGQSGLASSVRLRLQKKWLQNVGCSFTDEELEYYPFRIIKRLRTDNRTNNSQEYKAYIQYAYLLSGDHTWSLMSFLRYDIRKMSLLSIMRLLVRII